jgi:hypothetical protein
MKQTPMNSIFSHTTSKLDPSAGAMALGDEHFLKSRAAKPGFFLSIEDTPATLQPGPVAEPIKIEELSYGGSLSPLVQITLISCAEDLKKLSAD